MKRDPLQTARSRRLRQTATTAEVALWRALRNRRFIEVKFRGQQPIGPYIVDFHGSRSSLVIELDGDSHLDRGEYDAMRQAWLEDQGLRVLRFTNDDIRENLDGVLERVFLTIPEDPR